MGIPLDDFVHEARPEGLLLPNVRVPISSCDPIAGIGIEQRFNMTCDFVITNGRDDDFHSIPERIPNRRRTMSPTAGSGKSFQFEFGFHLFTAYLLSLHNMR